MTEYTPITEEILEECSNCDGRKCMDCVMRTWHEKCENSCPVCCPEYVLTREQVDELAGSSYENGFLAGQQAERERILALLMRFEAKVSWSWDDLYALIKGEEQ